MGKFDGILICTDLDGTLLRNDKSISKENLDAIEYFKANGGRFTFITGRMHFYSRDTYEVVKPNAPIGCNNGGGVYDFEQEKYLWSTTIDAEAGKALIEYVDKEMPGIGINVNTFYDTLFYKDNEAMVRFRRITNIENKKCDCYDIEEPIGKIIFADLDGEIIKELIRKVSAHPMAERVGLIRSESTLFEVLPKGFDKGTLVLKIAEILNINKNKTIAIGDFDNDVSMLKAAKLGIAVSNASENAKAAADLITVSNEEHAIAKVISDIENDVIKINS
jgi:Cof subfamily protein (haloacid dehalogenase superfamily)